MIRSARFVLAALVLLACTHASAQAATKPKLVLVAMSGPEDVQRMTAPFRHAAILKKSGKVADVAVVVYGRAVAALHARAAAVPDETRKQIAAAKQAGVHIYVCEHSLAQAGIAADAVAPEAERVPQGIVKIAELVGDGYVPMQY
ncbi:MAG: DsrE family protein [Myxococcales bacterium]|nr:DsrE family protein [Myxococcales bacterium]